MPRLKIVFAQHREQPGIKFASARNTQKARAAALKSSLMDAHFCNRLWPGVSSRLQILDQQRGFFSQNTSFQEQERERGKVGSRARARARFLSSFSRARYNIYLLAAAAHKINGSGNLDSQVSLGGFDPLLFIMQPIHWLDAADSHCLTARGGGRSHCWWPIVDRHSCCLASFLRARVRRAQIYSAGPQIFMLKRFAKKTRSTAIFFCLNLKVLVSSTKKNGLFTNFTFINI